MTDPLPRILERLDGVHRTGPDQYEAHCPTRPDKKKSLAISRGRNGAVVLHDHGGDSTENIVKAIGLTMADLYDSSSNGHSTNGRAPRAPKAPPPTSAVGTHPTPDAIVDSLRKGPTTFRHEYTNGDGSPNGIVLRWDNPDGSKDIRPIHRTAGGWKLGGMSTPRPLYMLPDLIARPSERVYVTEGEKAADAGRSIGLLCTTSAHGSQSAGGTDWTPLKGRDVCILRDNDAAGLKYANEVADILLKLGCTVRILLLPDIPDGGDIVEFIESRDSHDAAEILAEITALADAAPITTAVGDATPAPAGVGFDAALEDISRLVDGGKPIVETLATGIALIDETTGGLPLGEFFGIAAAPGVGKSVFADHCLVGALKRNPTATGIIVNLETPTLVRIARLVCSESVDTGDAHEIKRYLSLRRLLRGELTDADRRYYRTVIAGIDYGSRLHFVDSVSDANEIAKIIRDRKPTVVVVDHFGLVSMATAGNSPVEVFDSALAVVVGAIREVGAAGILVSEITKAALSNDAGLASVRGSARFASLASMFLTMTYADDSPADNPTLILSLLKNRHGRGNHCQRARLFGNMAHLSFEAEVKPIIRKKKTKKSEAAE